MPARTLNRRARRQQPIATTQSPSSPSMSRSPSQSVASSVASTHSRTSVASANESVDDDDGNLIDTVSDIVASARRAKSAAVSTSSLRQKAGKRKRAGSASGSEIHDIMEEDEEDVVEDEDEEKDSEESQGEEQGEDEQSEANSATESPGPRRRGRPRKARAKKKTGKKASPAMRSTDRREKAHSGSDKNREQSAKDAESESALFEAVRDPGTALEETSTDWIQSYEANKSEALKEMINFILRCCGCDASVTTYDIEDQDSATDTLAQIQEAFRQSQVNDYPLASKKPAFKKFRNQLIDFFSQFVHKSAEREILYEDESLMESIQIWITAMSSSTLRPFRLTSTTIALCMLTNLCEVASDIAKATGRSTKLLENEKRKSRSVKEKVMKLQNTVDDYAHKTETLEILIHDLFETIFLHRYRDIDAKVRTECIKELGKWMQTLPDVFFEGQYLRYMGWILSDANAGTRLEVVKSLTKLYQDNYFVGGLRQFTERFRPRLVEMATHDVDHSVRIAAIDLLDAIRAIGFLEQEDIDDICELVFDTNSRVRKAVTEFFLLNIKEIATDTLAEIGDEDEVGLHFSKAGESESVDSDDDGGEEEYIRDNKVKRSWITLKSIVAAIESYNSVASIGNPILVSNLEALIGGNTESRYSIAGRALWETASSLPDWTEILNYALFDLSSITVDEDDAIAQGMQKALTLTAQQELILFDLGVGAVHAAFTKADSPAIAKKVKKLKASEHDERKERISQDLIRLVPQLLKKFSADPETASNVLRFHNFIDLDVYQQLRQKSAYEELFDGICKLFMSFSDASIVREFVQAILHARSCEYVSDIVESRTKELQDEVVAQLHKSVIAYSDLATDALSKEAVADIANSMSRLMYLSSVTSTSEVLEETPRGASIMAADIIISLLERVASPEEDELDMLKSGVSVLRYFAMWKAKQAIETKSTINLHNFQETLDRIIDRLERIILSDVNLSLRHTAVCSLIDILVSINVMIKKESLRLTGFQTMLSPNIERAIFKLFGRLEKSYAKAINAQLLDLPEDTNADDEDAMAGTEDIEEQSKSDADGEIRKSKSSDDEATEENDVISEDKELQNMEREIRLCEYTGKLVIGILSGSVSRAFVARLRLNTKVLGSGYERVVDELAQLDESRETSKRQRTK